MKVLHVLDMLSFSGAEMMYVSAAHDFQNLGCQLYVLNTSIKLGEFSPFFVKAGYKVIHFPYNKSFAGRFAFFNRLKKFIKQEHIDIVHVHRNDIEFGMAYCAWSCGVKCVCTHHSIYRSNWYSIGYHRFLRWFMTYAFKCRQQSISYSVFENERNYYHNDSVLIYNWYDSNKFYPAQEGEKEKIREQLGISIKSKVIVSVGSCRELKRHQDIIEAVALLKKDISDICYLHLGEGEMLEDEKKSAKALGVEEHIRFIGNQTSVRNYLIASDVYVMTSCLEGLSLSTIEAMACRIPAVLYHVPGLKDFNKEKECSVQIKESPAYLAEACKRLFVESDKNQEIADNAYELVHTKFDQKKNVAKIFRLYHGE